MITELKSLLGAERLARLAKMPIVAEGKGIEAHLQAACKDAVSPVQALIKALKSAGSRPTAEDVKLFQEDAESRRRADAEKQAAGQEATAKAETAPVPKAKKGSNKAEE